MKTIQNFIRLLVLGVFVFFAGILNAQEMGNTFKSPEEAANKAKKDFLEILRSGQKFDFGVDAAALEKSQPGKLVERASLNFERLLNANDSLPLGEMVGEQLSSVVPLELEGQAVTVVEVRKEREGWKIAGFGDQKVSQSLNQVSRTVKELGGGNVTLYEVPNLQAMVYGVRTRNGEQYLTEYGGLSLRKPVSSQDLVPVLREDAITFQKEFGDLVKKQKLVD